jgi:hypothetical protein
MNIPFTEECDLLLLDMIESVPEADQGHLAVADFELHSELRALDADVLQVRREPEPEPCLVLSLLCSCEPLCFTTFPFSSRTRCLLST